MDSIRNRLHSEWIKGTNTKVIAFSLGMEQQAVINQISWLRVKEGPEIWPYRKTPRGGRERSRQIYFGEFYDKAQRRALELGMSLSAYIRSLVRRDI